MSIDRRGALRAAVLLATLAVGMPAPPAFAQRLYEDVVVAVTNDRAPEVKALLARGVDPNTVDPNGDPLLYVAARAGYVATVDVLLAANASVDARSRFGDTPLMGAALAATSTSPASSAREALRSTTKAGRRSSTRRPAGTTRSSRTCSTRARMSTPNPRTARRR